MKEMTVAEDIDWLKEKIQEFEKEVRVAVDIDYGIIVREVREDGCRRTQPDRPG